MVDVDQGKKNRYSFWLQDIEKLAAKYHLTSEKIVEILNNINEFKVMYQWKETEEFINMFLHAKKEEGKNSLFKDIKTFELSDLKGRTLTIGGFSCENLELIIATDGKSGEFFILKEIVHPM